MKSLKFVCGVDRRPQAEAGVSTAGKAAPIAYIGPIKAWYIRNAKTAALFLEVMKKCRKFRQ